MNTLYLQAHQAFQEKQKERRAEYLSARNLTLFALHIQLCSARTFGLFFCRDTHSDSYIFPHSIISPFRGIGGGKPSKSKAARKSAAFDWDFGTQSPCLLYNETHPAGQKEKRLSDTGILAYLCAIRYRKPLPCPLGHIFL